MGVQPATASQRLGLPAACTRGQIPKSPSLGAGPPEWTSNGPVSNVAGGLVRGGTSTAVTSGAEPRDQVAELGANLGLEVQAEVAVGRRLWGARRRIDVVLRHKKTRKSLGIECKYQRTQGTAEQKISATIEDIRTWPIRGIVIFSGEGFSPHMTAYLLSTGMAVQLADAKTWLELYFGL